MKVWHLLLLFLVITATIAAVMLEKAVAQGPSLRPPAGSINYYGPNDVYWRLESTTGIEEITFTKLDSKRFDISIDAPTLFDSQKRNYPVKAYRATYPGGEYTPPVFVEVTGDYIAKPIVDLTVKERAQVSVDNAEDWDNLYLKFGFTSSTYSAATNIIHITGYEVGTTPWDFKAIYDASVAAGWTNASGSPCMENPAPDLWKGNAKILMGGQSGTPTYFEDTNCTYYSQRVRTANGQYSIYVGSYTSATFGVNNSDTLKRGANGVDFIDQPATNNWGYWQCSTAASCSANFYGCTFNMRENTGGGTCKVRYPDDLWWCFFGKNTGTNLHSGSDVYRCTNVRGSQLEPASGASVNHYQSNWTTQALRRWETSSTTTTTVENLTAHNASALNGVIDLDNFDSSNTFTAINCEIYDFDSGDPVWTINWDSSTGGSFLRKYTIDALVTNTSGTPVDGATFKVWDVNDDLVINTTSTTTGEIPQQTYTYYYVPYNTNTPTAYYPFTLEVASPGSATYTQVFEGDSQADWIISLADYTSPTPCAAVSDVSTWLEDNVIMFVLLFIALGVTALVYWRRHLMLMMLAAMLWTAGGIYIMARDNAGAVEIIAGIPCIMFALYLMFDIAFSLFRGSETN